MADNTQLERMLRQTRQGIIDRIEPADVKEAVYTYGVGRTRVDRYGRNQLGWRDAQLLRELAEERENPTRRSQDPRWRERASAALDNATVAHVHQLTSRPADLVRQNDARELAHGVAATVGVGAGVGAAVQVDDVRAVYVRPIWDAVQHGLEGVVPPVAHAMEGGPNPWQLGVASVVAPVTLSLMAVPQWRDQRRADLNDVLGAGIDRAWNRKHDHDLRVDLGVDGLVPELTSTPDWRTAQAQVLIQDIAYHTRQDEKAVVSAVAGAVQGHRAEAMVDFLVKESAVPLSLPPGALAAAADELRATLATAGSSTAISQALSVLTTRSGKSLAEMYPDAGVLKRDDVANAAKDITRSAAFDAMPPAGEPRPMAVQDGKRAQIADASTRPGKGHFIG